MLLPKVISKRYGSGVRIILV